MSNISEATEASTATFVTALAFNAIVFGAQIGVFTLLRPHFKAIYEPRTFVGVGKHIKPLTPGPKPGQKTSLRVYLSTLLWPFALINADFRQIIKSNGLDAYFFVRFLRMALKIFVPIWIVSWITLLPITSVATGESSDGLVKFTFGNVSVAQQARYWAHLVCVWIFTFYIMYTVREEMKHFLVTRQQHLTEKKHSRSVQAKTILVTGIPQRYLTPHALHALFDDLPGGVKQIWINRNLKELPDIYDRRADATAKLEKAEVAYMKTAIKVKLAEAKASKKGKAPKAKAKGDPATQDSEESPLPDIDETFVPRDQRPSHKTGFLGLFGAKVDTIEWCREEIATCTKLLDEGRAEIEAAAAHSTADFALLGEGDFSNAALDEDGNPIQRANRAGTWKDVDGDGEGDVFDAKGVLVGGVKGAVGGVKGASGKVVKSAVGGVKGAASTIKGALKGASGEEKYPALNSAFITFNKQIAAHLAVQALAHHMPYTMSSRYIEVAPSDVIFANLNLNPYEQKIRMAISYAATAGLIILWAIPVGFVGVISNISTVCTKASWLAWICTLPKVVIGVISGILPPVLLAVLMMLLPIVLRLLARFEGIPKYTGLELSLMTRFFMFQVLHSFLIVTLSSGIVASLQELTSDPTSIPSVLAQNLPKASTFFLTYIVLQGLAGTAGAFLQIVRLIIYYVKLTLLGSTPRSIYLIKYTPGSVAWGTLFPGITLLVVISLAYSIISPIINGLAVLAFFLFYQLYKYLFLWVFEQDQRLDTGGLFFPKAIQHVFVGLYLQQICLAALFFLARNADEKPSSIPQGALMIVLLVFTAGFHAILNNSFNPLIVALPLSLKDRVGKGVSVEEKERDVDDVRVDAGDRQAKEIEDAADGRRSDVSTLPDEERAAARTHQQERFAIAEETRLADLEPTSRVGAVPLGERSANHSGASGVTKTDRMIASDKEVLERNEVEEYGFAHPAASRPQRTVWIPQFSVNARASSGDKVSEEAGGEEERFVRALEGMSEREVEACRVAGVDASEEGAGIDGKGKVAVVGAPPGYAGL